jgi:hypothetical protein
LLRDLVPRQSEKPASIIEIVKESLTLVQNDWCEEAQSDILDTIVAGLTILDRQNLGDASSRGSLTRAIHRFADLRFASQSWCMREIIVTPHISAEKILEYCRPGAPEVLIRDVEQQIRHCQPCALAVAEGVQRDFEDHESGHD